MALFHLDKSVPIGLNPPAVWDKTVKASKRIFFSIPHWWDCKVKKNF